MGVMLASWPPFCYSSTVLSCNATSQGCKFIEDTAGQGLNPSPLHVEHGDLATGHLESPCHFKLRFLYQ